MKRKAWALGSRLSTFFYALIYLDPPGGGPYPGMVVCLGVVPFGVDHPQVPILGKALARDIVSATRSCGDEREPWQVDPLTRKVFIHSLTAWLEPGEAEQFRSAFTNEGGHFDGCGLSADGQAVYSLLTALDEDQVETALHGLPAIMQERLTTLSPMNYLKDIHAPLILLLHDRGDQVIAVGESKRLFSTLSGHAGVHYTEMQFSHLDPVKGKLPFLRLVRELGKFFLAVYPLFRQAE